METTSTFLDAWSQYMFYGMLTCITIGILIILYHEFKIFQIKEYKKKYDYVNRHEIRYFWYAVILFTLAAGFTINTIGNQLIIDHGPRWFFVRVFISLCFLVVCYFTLNSFVRIYYPKKLANRLNKLRNKPRISPAGNVMRKLSESEEDRHLENHQIEEEKIQVVDYDVWIDEKTGYKKIEKYVVTEQSEECPECGYFTLKINSEEVGQSPTFTEPGYLIEHLRCTYCHYREKREVVVAQLSTNVA